MNKTYKLTQQGVEELNKELQKLLDRRPEITERIRSARELGDLSENAEYASARTEQERTEIRIKEIETILKNVEIIKASADDGRVDLGDTVTLHNDKGKRQYQVVGTVEADPLEGKISDESPIGIALLGKHIGDEVKITLPSEIVTYKIINIS